jgi:hypothetical protein
MSDLINGREMLKRYQKDLCYGIACKDCSMCTEDGGCRVEKWIDTFPPADRPQKVIAQITFDEEKLREIVKEAVERFKEEYEITDRPQEWIPCKRRLPEEGVVVLVCMNIKGHKCDWEEQRCIEFGRISSDRYDIDGAGWEWLNESGTDFWEPDWNDNILAWMPLPAPWEGAGNE